jgi:hypothetical protein
MRIKLATAAKAIMLFLIVGLALPLVLEKEITVVWMMVSAAISLAITVVPAYVIARLKQGRANRSALTPRQRQVKAVVDVLDKRWVRVGVGAFLLFITMAFVVPLLEGEKLNEAYLIISAITSPVAAITADYLDIKWKARKRS